MQSLVAFILLVGVSIFPLILPVSLRTANTGGGCPARFSQFHRQHTACLAPNKYCQLTKTGVSKKERQLILDVHNYLRNLIASGNETALGFPPAANMRTLTWDDELAYVAQRHADQCRFEHDCYDCRRTEKYPVVGQNLYTYRTTRSSAEPKWRDIIKEWYDEIKIAPPVVARSFDLFQLNIGHFTQIAWAETDRIGCGYSTFHNFDGNPIFKTVQLYTCNYAPGGNYFGEKMYEDGAGASRCPARFQRSRSFPALCEASASSGGWSTNHGELVDNRLTSGSETTSEQFQPTSNTVVTSNQLVAEQSPPPFLVITYPTSSEQPPVVTNNQQAFVGGASSFFTSTPTTTTTDTNNGGFVSTTLNTVSEPLLLNNNNNIGVPGLTISVAPVTTSRIITAPAPPVANQRPPPPSNTNDINWTSRLNNWKNNANPAAGSGPTTNTWKWRSSGDDWKKYLSNYTTFSGWTQWNKPASSSSTFNNNRIINRSSGTDDTWRLSHANLTWWSNWTQPASDSKPKTVATTRLPKYTWSLSLGFRKNVTNAADGTQTSTPAVFNHTMEVDMTPNRLRPTNTAAIAPF